MEGHCSTGQIPQWAVVPMEEEEEITLSYYTMNFVQHSVTCAKYFFSLVLYVFVLNSFFHILL